MLNIHRLTQIALALTCAAPLYCSPISSAIASDRVPFGENGCEAYAWGYAVAQTQQHYVEICGGKGGKFLSFYAIERNSADPERTKIQIDNVSRQKNTFVAVSGGDRYTLTREYLTLKRDGKVVFREKVINYKKLS
jgi:hypothetical protein